MKNKCTQICEIGAVQRIREGVELYRWPQFAITFPKPPE